MTGIASTGLATLDLGSFASLSLQILLSSVRLDGELYPLGELKLGMSLSVIDVCLFVLAVVIDWCPPCALPPTP